MQETGHLDLSAPVRSGEELDTAALAAYLRAHLPAELSAGQPSRSSPPLSAGEAALADELVVEQFPRGYSNLTYLLRFGERELVLRRPPFGANIKSAHDMGREYRILRALAGVYAKAPRPLLLCEDLAVLGAPFYVMERVRGVILRAPLPEGLAVAPADMRRICLSLVDTLVELHAVDYRAAGLADLGKAEGYVARQVRGWAQRYEQAQTHDLPAMHAAAAWLAAQMPPARGTALIHNDFKLDNLLLDPQDLAQVKAVLDWEMATIGDPLMDLGTTLGYWIEPGDPPELQRIGLAGFPGSLRRGEVVARYAAGSGRDPAALAGEIVYYYVFGLFKIAVIAQQIYWRFRQGHTSDPRFGGLDAVVAACAGMAAHAIASGRIESS